MSNGKLPDLYGFNWILNLLNCTSPYQTKETNAVLLAREKGRGEIEELLLKAGATDDMGLWFNIRKRISKTFRIKG
jgi:hypothetical protein